MDALVSVPVSATSLLNVPLLLSALNILFIISVIATYIVSPVLLTMSIDRLVPSKLIKRLLVVLNIYLPVVLITPVLNGVINKIAYIAYKVVDEVFSTLICKQLKNE